MVASIFPQSKFRIWLVAIIVVSAALVAASQNGAVAHDPEGGDHVDVGLTLGIRDSSTAVRPNIVVVNRGSKAAYDVEVVVDVVYPEDVSHFYEVPKVPVGFASLENDGRTLRWSIPRLGGMQREEVEARVLSEVGERYTPNHITYEAYPHELFGKVTTASFESDLHKGNNTDRVWSYKNALTLDHYHQAAGNYVLGVSVDDPSPSPGDTVEFTIKTEREDPYTTPGLIPPPIDLKVDVELTEDLSVSGTPSFSSTNRNGETRPVPASMSYSDGVFNVGTLKAGDGIINSVTLPVRVSGVVNGQCLTANLTGNPPPGVGPYDDDISDNVAELCLGRFPPYFTSADLQEFVTHPCVGNTDPPCDSADDVRVRAIYTGVDPPRVLGPGTPVIIVPDTSETRKFDDDTTSVNAGDEVSWQVLVQVSLRPFTSEYERWKDYGASFSYEMPGKENFDKLHIRVSWGNVLLNDGQRQATLISNYKPVAAAAGNGPFDFTAEFEKLGTYMVQHSTTATHDNNTPGDTTDDVEYPATGSYLFHVGPITDLEVQATPATGAMTTENQVAFTVTATYHGPDYRAPAVRVPVTLPAGMRFVRVDSDDFVQDNNNPQTGVWDIGELKVKGFRHSLRQPESETLTIVAELTGDVTGPVTGSIKNNQDYCVRIKSGGTPADDLPCDSSAVPDDYTEHSAPYYDYQPDNNQFSLNPPGGWRAVAQKNPPYLTGLSITSAPTPNVNGPGSYLIGNVIEVEARFSKVVYVTGSPTLRLQIGNEEREAEYAGGSGTDTLRFEYTVGKWDRDDDGVSIPANPFVLRGNPIRDGDGNDAMLDFAGLDDDRDHPVGGPGTPATPPEPQAAGRLTATARDGAVDLEWPAGSDGDKVFWQLWRNDAPNWWDIAPRSMGSRLGYTVTGLENGREYMFRVRAHYKYEHGDTPGPPSAPAFATPTAPPAPPPGQTPPPGQPTGPNTPPEFDRDTAWADYCVNGGTGSGVEVARVTAFDQDGDRLTFYQVKGFDEIGDQHFTVSNVTIGDTYWAVIRTSRSIPRNLEPADGFIGIDLEVNDGRGGLDQIGVSLQYDASGGNCQDTGSRSTEAEESGPSVLAAVRTWAGSVRNWWAEFANRTFNGPTFLSWRDAWFAAHHGAVPPSSR